MAEVRRGSTHGVFLVIRMTLFFLVSMILFESGKGFVHDGGCPTPDIKLLIDNHEKGAEKVVTIGKNRLALVWETANSENNNKIPIEDQYRWALLSQEEIDNMISRGRYTQKDKDEEEKKRKENEQKDAKAREIQKKFNDTFNAQKFSDGKSCITGKKVISEAQYKERIPFGYELCDNAWDYKKVNSIVSKELGYRCSNKKCHFHHKIDDFVCHSTSNQAMALLLTVAILFLVLYSNMIP